MKNKMMKFLAPEDAGGGGESGKAGVAATAPEPTKEEGASEQKTETPPAAPSVDVEALTKGLAEKFGDTLETRFPKTKEEDKTVDTLTPEERKKLLNVWEPTKEWQTKFDNLETRDAALAELRDGFIRHGDTISQYRLKEMERAFDGKYGKVLQFMDDYQNERATERFHKQYAELADPALEPIVTSVTEGLSKSGKKFDDEATLFAAIASGVEKVIQVHNKDFKLTAGSSPATTKKGQSNNSLPVTTPGASGGTGTKGKDETPKKNWAGVFQP